MCRIKISAVSLILFVAATAIGEAAPEKRTISLLIGEAVSHKASQAVLEVTKGQEAAGQYDFRLYTTRDLEETKIDDKVIIRSEILIVDTMYREITDYVLRRADFRKTRVYSLREKGSGKTEKIIFDDAVAEYYKSPTVENIKNLLLFLLNRDCRLDVSYNKPACLPEKGFFHPDARRVFASFVEYLDWYRKRGLHEQDGFWVGVADYSSYATPGDTCKAASELISSLEKNGINVLPCFAYPSRPEALFLDETGKSRVDVICGLCFKMSQTANEVTRENLSKLDVAVLNPARLWTGTISDWEKSDQGLGPTEISWQICVPEFNGLIEPSVIGGKIPLEDVRSGKEVYRPVPITENIEFLVKRVKAWRNLQTKKNRDKRIAVVYWNHTPGKQNVGASYLNVFRSLEHVLRRMRAEGYSIEGALPSEKEIKDLVLRSGRNIGSWAPGELEGLLKSEKVIRWPVSEYVRLYNGIDEDYRKKMEEQWGRPHESKIMVKDNEFIIPYVPLGNIILLPQPSRGWGDDPMKLYHSPTVWPHHQYTAFYLWLKHVFKADAIISLGKHGTHEWLPGRQAGLSQSCPPEVLIQDLPNLYPYIVDNIGEGIQAKRRGRAVIIDHLIPALKKAGIYQEYRELAVLIDEYNDALPRSKELAGEKFRRIKILVKELGLDKDLLLKVVDENAIEAIEHYILELQEGGVPYGLHTYGVSPQGEALEELSRLIKERNEEIPLSDIRQRLGLCHLEMDRLMAGLEGRYVVSGEGNDPLRNPEAIPTGRNFYGFDSSKVPSKDAYGLGRKQAEEMIRKYLKEDGKYPGKIGLVLWATEVHRNEGSQVGTALYLMGMKPVWDRNNRVTGTEPIPGGLLGRARIDVHLQASGLFRDSFPNVMILLDDAVRQASQLRDVENFIAEHSAKIKAYLKEKGYAEEDAESLSHTRVFSEAPGSYVTKVQELVPNSGMWETDEEIADVFIHHTAYAYGKQAWGSPLKSVYTKSLEDVDVTMHTLSSSVYGVMDNDDVFGYLGGVAMAVKRIKGEYPDVVVSDQKDPAKAHIEDIERTIGRELRSRYLNPKWIEGMKQENYAGAREVAKFAEYMWGWQVTTPFAVDAAKWEQTYQVYVRDKYNLDLKAFFDEHNPWARQSVSARMLEAVRKQYWDAPETIRKDLARTYATSVIEKGLACCDHTCNNPALNQMVVNIVSLPGVLSPELVAQFQAVISRSTGMKLEEAAEKRKSLQEHLAQVTEEIRREEEPVKAKARDKDEIEGYEMVEKKTEDTRLTTSGAAWAVMAIVLGFLGLLSFGWLRKR